MNTSNAARHARCHAVTHMARHMMSHTVPVPEVLTRARSAQVSGPLAGLETHFARAANQLTLGGGH